ncbi:hypothetical protein [Ruegeria atlantica]|uniref:hypothetical protein n=1 Tax=Ruegeria atlantica TaxID=81569 RepID=UPI00147CAF6D|nr:hypothetical protein [Ruegeria atlantica]
MKRCQVVFLGPQLPGLNRRKLLSYLRKSKYLSADIAGDTSDRLAIPSFATITDEFAFNFPAIDPTADYVVLVTRYPIEENYFARSNIAQYSHARSSNQVQVICTTHELDEFCTQAQVPLERALSGSAILSVFSGKFVQQGGNYFDLWIPARETSVFGFCEDKAEIIEKFDSGEIGPRARTVLEKRGIPNEQIAALEKDVKILRRTKLDKLASNLNKNRDIVISICSFLLGILSTLVLSN